MPRGKLQEYKRVAGEIRDRIAVGDFRPEGKLPTERAFCELLQVSRVTVRSALQELEKEGLISRVQGAGTFVAQDADKGSLLDRHSICLVFNDYRGGVGLFVNPYAAMLLEGLKKAASRLSFKISILPIPPDISFVEYIKSKPALVPESKGVILGTRINFAESYEWLRNRGHSVVALGPPPASAPCLAEHSYVDIDNKAGGAMAARHLLALGRRDIFFLGGPGGVEQTVATERIKGIQAAFGEQGLAFEKSHIRVITPWSEEEGRGAVAALLKSGVACDALIVHGDMATLGAMWALGEAGMRIPDDVAVVTYDDFPWMMGLYSPQPTAVRQPFDEMAESAAEMVVESMNAFDFIVKIKILQPSLIIRESCGAGKAGRIKKTVIGH